MSEMQRIELDAVIGELGQLSDMAMAGRLGLERICERREQYIAMRADLPELTPMDPRTMHGLALGEGVDAGNWYTYCPACSWDAGEQVGKCLEPFVAANWPDASVFVPKPSDGAS